MEFRQHIKRAIQHCGSQQKLAEKIGLTQPGVSYLLTDAKNVSAEIAVAIERATEGAVSRRDLRPDLFGLAA